MRRDIGGETPIEKNQIQCLTDPVYSHDYSLQRSVIDTGLAPELLRRIQDTSPLAPSETELAPLQSHTRFKGSQDCIRMFSQRKLRQMLLEVAGRRLITAQLDTQIHYLTPIIDRQDSERRFR